jgi:hypothetical protein
MGVWCTVTELGPDESALAEWPLRGIGAPSIEIVECLARMQLELHRGGRRIVLSDVCEELLELLELVGLSDLSDSQRAIALPESDN